MQRINRNIIITLSLLFFSNASFPNDTIDASPEEIQRDYESNAYAADLKYDGKFVAVKGRIEKISVGYGGVPIIRFVTARRSTFTPRFLMDTEEPKHMAHLAKLKTGDITELFCVGRKSRMSPQMDLCVFYDVR